MQKELITLVCLWGVCAVAQTTTTTSEEPEEVRLHTGSAGEYKALFELPGLTDQQRKTAEERLQARNQALQAFNASPEGQKLIALRTELAAARRNKETEKIGPLREQIQPLADAYFKLRAQGRIDILSVLTPEQLVRYTARAIHARAMRGIDFRQLTSEQSEQVMQWCVEAARQHFQKHTLQEDPFFHTTEPRATEIRRQVQSLLSGQKSSDTKSPDATPPARAE